jgi:hypothetical protein
MPATDLAFSDLHIQLLAAALVPPGEKLVARSVGKKTPLWSLGMMSQTFVLLATERRLWILEHRWNPLTGMKLHAAHQIQMGNLSAAKVKGILWNKKLHIAGQSEAALVGGEYVGTAAPFKCTMSLPNGFFAPIKQNVLNAKTIAASVEGARSFGAAPSPAALPLQAPSAYPPPQPQPLPPAYAAAPTMTTPYAPPVAMAHHPAAVPSAHPHAMHPSSAPPPVNPAFGQHPMTAAPLPSGHWPR